MGVRYLRVDSMWSLLSQAPGTYDWEWLDALMNKVAEVNRVRAEAGLPLIEILLVCYATPQYLEPTWPRIPGWSGPPAIAIMRPEWVIEWQAFLTALSNRYPQDRFPRVTFNIATETTLPLTWADPDNQNHNGGPQRYVDLVLKPASEVLHAAGRRVMAVGTTMRDEDWQEALAHVGVFLQHANLFDRLDLHVYRNSGRDTVTIIKRLLVLLDMTITISESGFASGDSRQLTDWREVWNFLQSDKASENVDCLYGYQWWSGPAGLLRDDGSMRPAAEELARRLE